MLRGCVINGSPCVLAGGRLHRLPATHQTVREWAAELASLTPCPHCGARGGCDYPEWMLADTDRLLREEGNHESN